MSLLAAGDVVRVREWGTEGEWCVCQVEVVSQNGESIALRVQHGVLRVGGSMILGALLIWGFIYISPLTLMYINP